MTRPHSDPGPPDRTLVQYEPYGSFTAAPDGVRVTTALAQDERAVTVQADRGVSRVLLRWRRPVAPGTRVLGDTWERSYGELEWRVLRAERPLPWLFLAHETDTGRSWGMGVRVRPAAFAFWTVDVDGVSLYLDLRAGDAPVRLGERGLTAAVVHRIDTDERPFAAHRQLCAALCPDPLTVSGPLVGANNWYYAYGRDFDAAAVLRDARTVADLAGDHPVRPYAVVDDGWSAAGTAQGRAGSGGPWDRLRRPAFEDMAGLAGSVRAEGARPGIWYRPLLTREPPPGARVRETAGAFALDPSDPATPSIVAADVARIAGWGYDLLKHDFSTVDALGRWGHECGPSVTGTPPAGRRGASGWRPADDSRTNAEVLTAFYATVREAAGAMSVLGCNVVGHLAAGLVHAQRTGDDTSGRHWDRTRRIGVNTLAFRLAQHGTFFTLDADCVPSTPQTPWALNRRFLDLVARSGTALFVSVDPATRSDALDAELAAALRLALDGGSSGGVEPLDWLDSPTPSRWRDGQEDLQFDWLTADGADPFEWQPAGD